MVRISDYGEKIEYIDDFALLSENKDTFVLTNKKDCYFTTCDSWFELYKNGEKIDDEIFDSKPEYTIKINYGALEQAFKIVTADELQRLL